MPLRILVVAAGLLAAAPLNADETRTPATDPAQKLNGTWTPTKGTLAGKEMPPAALNSIRLEIKGKTYKVTAESVDEGSVELFLDEKPWGLDVIGENGPNKGKKFPCIFKFEGETLRVCYDLSQKQRPKEFASKKGTLLFLVDYKRTEKK